IRSFVNSFLQINQCLLRITGPIESRAQPKIIPVRWSVVASMERQRPANAVFFLQSCKIRAQLAGVWDTLIDFMRHPMFVDEEEQRQFEISPIVEKIHPKQCVPGAQIG